MRFLFIVLICMSGLTSINVSAQPVVGAFEGSAERSTFETQFDSFTYAHGDGADPSIERIEGSIFSRVLLKPEDKSNLEVLRSYERELQAAGFTILLSMTPADVNPQNLVRTVYRAPNNDLESRSYARVNGAPISGDLARIATFGHFYLVASQTQGATTLLVSIVLERERHLYLIDEVTIASMETGTVTLSLERMRSQIEDAGRIAIYDVQFATGSAEIDPNSSDALAIIASYLNETAGGFYIIGHTDDTGTLMGNMTLSAERAAAIRDALVADYGIDSDRLVTRGVGPVSPISNNKSEAGRALNRRVEIVERLSND